MVYFPVISRDGSVPVRYGIRLNSDDKYSDVRGPLSKLTEIDEDLLLFVELYGAYVKVCGLVTDY